MLDVHPPHSPTHTWKDFFIHIATISVGLLIAVGLEQTVEFFHHRHQYHQLEEDMLAEAQRNSTVMVHTLADQRVGDAWFAKFLTAARNAPLRDGFVDFDMPPKPDIDTGWIINPSRAVWPVATANGLASLVPAEQAQIYNRLDYEAIEAVHISSLAGIEKTKVNAISARLGIPFNPGDHIHIKQADLEEFLRAATEEQELALRYQVRIAFWKGASDALLHHVSTMDEMFPYINKEAAAVPHL